MFHFLLSNLWYKQRVKTRLLLSATQKAKSPYLLTNLDPDGILSFARCPTGFVFMANGLTDVAKWDGQKTSAIKAGVPATAAALTIASTGSGTITGFYSAFQRFLDEDDNPSNLSTASNEVSVTKAGTITYSGVAVPTDPRIVKKQILRNTAGQGLVYYVDVETNDLAKTTFTSTRNDDNLEIQESVALFDERGNTLANRFGIPRNDKPIVAYYLNRLFLTGEIDYETGNVVVTCASKTVTGIATNWTQSLKGRQLFVLSGTKAYEIDTIDVAAQTLTLVLPYRDPGDTFGVYSIRSFATDRSLLFYTEPGQYDAWSVFNALEVGVNESGPESGGSITGLMATNSFLFILKERSIYRFTYQRDPAIDGGIFLAARRGCINNRCWVHVDDSTFIMDERGIYVFDGSDGTQDVSQPIQTLFRREVTESTDLQINWSAKKYFHAIHHQVDTTVRFFVSLTGTRYPRHALCFNYETKAWWIEEYAFPIGASSVVSMNTGTVPIMGGPAKRVFIHAANLDGPTAEAGTIRAKATSASQISLSDSQATFASSGLAGSPISIVKGRGKGQTRIISSVASGKIKVTQPWLVLPDTTSVYQLGGVAWRRRSGFFQWVSDERENPRRIQAFFTPTKKDATADIRVYEDDADTSPIEWAIDYPPTPSEGMGVTITKGNTDIEIDLTRRNGQIQVRLDDWFETYTDLAHSVAVEIRGFTGQETVKIDGLSLEGAVGQQSNV